MPYAAFDMIGSFDVDFDPIIDGQNTINMYETVDAGSPEGKALIPIPGSKTRIIVDDQPEDAECRAAFVFRDRAYFVVGTGVYEIDASLTPTRTGDIETSIGFVQFSANQTQVILVDGAAGYLIENSLLTKITDVNFPADPVSVDYLDGRFLVGQGSTNKWYASSQEDGSMWNALEFAEITTTPDTIVAISVLKRRIFLMGQQSVEVWYDAGTPGFPFARDNNLSYDFGCAASGSVANSQGYLIWLGRTVDGVASVMMSTGGQVQAISTHQVDLAFQNYERVDDARSYIYKINGHIFYVISFPTADVTWSYDLTTNKWFQMSMIDDSRYVGQCHAYLNGSHLIGSYKEPKILEVSRNFVTNDLENIKKTRISKIFRPTNGSRVCVNMFELRFRQGETTVVDNDGDLYFNDSGAFYFDDDNQNYYDDFFVEDRTFDADPVVYLSVSNNGGKFFGNEVSSPYGKQGEYEFRTIWNRLGIGTQFTFKMVSYNTIPLILTGCDINYDVLRA